MKILIVDDNKDNLYLLEVMLKKDAHEVVSATNGAEALQKLRSDGFDMIITDILMPVMDGFQLCRECKMDEKLKSIPFVFYTATYVDAKDEEFALALGADRFIRKPMEPDEFIRIIRELIKAREMKKLETKEPVVTEEKEVLKLYSERLIKKLEKKMKDLEAEVTRRKLVEKELRRSEEKYRLIAENTKDVIITTDMSLNITYVSPSAKYLASRTLEEIMTMPLEKLLTPTSLELMRRTLAEELTQAEGAEIDPARSRVLELEVIRPDGSTVLTETRASFLRRPDGQATGIIAVMRDITERKKAEEERRRLELKALNASRLASIGEMAAGIAHEINNPLTGIVGYAQLLMSRKDLPSDIKADLKVITDSAQRVAGIVKGLLTFARQTKPERQLADINSIVENTLALRAYSLKTNNISVTTELDPHLPQTLVDSGQIQQVLLNLIVNAETEMKLAHGKGNLVIITQKTNNTIKISVKDDGPGIKPEIMDRIFDPFFTTRKTGEGTGLGLSICHSLVTEHGGRIYAESEPGEGATFIVELPIVSSREKTKSVAEKSTKKMKASILVVDDEPVIRDFANRILTDEGHHVDTASNGIEALEKIKQCKYDLMLIDIKLPHKSGMELYKEIQQIDRSLARKVIFITGDVMGVDTRRFLSETKAAYIEKPFDIQLLNLEVQRALATTR